MSVDLAPGDRFGRYKILEVLGEGAMARVFRVFAPQLKGTAALKVSRNSLGDGDSAARALREVAVVRTLNNRHVPKIHDAGRGPDGHVFILMEELEGEQLDHWHDFDTPLPCGQAVWAVHQACLGLGEAHAHGIVHRDIKPENIWVEPDHNVRVLDFGLARSWTDSDDDLSANVTMAGMVMGTPRYMQPEQLHTTLLTPASDIYSLGTILYELLTGHSVYFADQPFSRVRESYRDRPMVWLNAHDDEKPVPMGRYRIADTFPDSLEKLVMQCLRKKPEERPQDAAALGNALGEIMHYDLGIATAATLRIELPWGGYDERLLLPGTHRIGSSEVCEIRLKNDKMPQLAAILSWDGAPEFPELRVLVDELPVIVNGINIEERKDLGPADTVKLGDFELKFNYPRV
ncbi:MAG: serine/threonine protein kinase [Nannocystaceae bacterium]|nr:serine/threonine protein kinase [Nannocystaceae bacterium]